MTASDLLAAFLDGRGPSSLHEASALEGALGDALLAGRAAHPELAVDPIAWMRALAVLAPETLPAIAPFGQLVIAVLYLAFACGTGDPRALAICDALLVREATFAATAARLHESLRDEGIQIVRTLAFARRPERPAAIFDYAGRGTLTGWLRVLVARELVRLAKAQQRSVSLEDQLLEIEVIDEDPVLEQLKSRYRAELASAFRIALDALSKRDRMLLRYQLIDGLTIDEIGALSRVHRATAARWLATIRDGLVERTRELLGEALGVDSVEAASIVRMVQSQLDVSVIRHLQPRRGPR